MGKNMFELIKRIYDFAAENPEKIKPYHWALYIAAIERCNRLSWKNKFGLPTDGMMEITGITHRKTYYKARQDLEDYGFIRIKNASVNQHSATIIEIIGGKYKDLHHSSSIENSKLKHSTATDPILRLRKTSENFIKLINNIEGLEKILIDNDPLMKNLAEKSIVKGSEKKLVQDFLREKFASGENLLWKTEVDLTKHYRNWFTKINSQKEKIEIKKADRR